jgi:hypothetical protein
MFFYSDYSSSLSARADCFILIKLFANYLKLKFFLKDERIVSNISSRRVGGESLVSKVVGELYQ